MLLNYINIIKSSINNFITYLRKAIMNLSELTGKKLEFENFKLTSSSIWIIQLEKSIKELMGEFESLDSYYTPKNDKTNVSWM